MKNSPTEVKKKETEERKRQEELEKQKRNETYQLLGGSPNDSDADGTDLSSRSVIHLWMRRLSVKMYI